MDTILSALSKNQEKTVNEPVEVGKNIWTDEVVDTRKWILKVRKVLILFIINYFWWEMWKLVWGKQNGKEIQNPNIPSIGPLNEAGKTIKVTFEYLSIGGFLYWFKGISYYVT